MFERFRKRFRGGRRNPCNCPTEGVSQECIALCQGAPGEKYCVMKNSDAKTREMGLYPGAEVHVIKNVSGDPSVVVAVGEARYAIHRGIAGVIIVRPEK